MRFVVFILFVAFVVAPQAQAQTTEDISVAPIECFSRTTADAVRVGETLTLVLTCAVLETAGTIVVPDETVLDAAVLQVAPFEIVDGTHPPDVRTTSRRVFQYEYRVRYIGEQFGRDVTLPGTRLTYRVQSRGQQGATIEGRERTYDLPSHQIRIQSLIPAGSTALRDPAPATFTEIQQRNTRADALRIASIAVLIGAGAMALWAIAGALRRPDKRLQAAKRLPSEAAVVRTIRRELAAARRERLASGWSPELAARTLAPVRAAATLADGRAVAMTPITDGRKATEGQLVVASGIFPKRISTLVSGSAAGDPKNGASSYGELRDALNHLTRAAYGREGANDSDLDDALNAAERAAGRLASQHGWIRVTARRLLRRRAEERQAWAR
jgi:hypothetical protein